MDRNAVKTTNKDRLPKLFCLVGLPGSGKTFFAEKFSEEYQIPFLNLNKWRFFMFDAPEFSREEDTRLTQYASELLTELFKTKKSILLEGNLYSRADRQRYSQLARRHGYQPVVIWVQNVDSESKRRSVRLNQNLPKDFLITPEVFEDLKQRFTPPNEVEKPIVISGKHAFKMQYRSVLKRIICDDHSAEVRPASLSSHQPARPKARVRII